MTLPVVEAAMDDLRAAHRALLHAVDSLSEDDWARYVPYGDWTVKDLIAHCIGDMSPRGIGLILAGVLTPEFIADTGKMYDVRARNAAVILERREFSREDLRQMLFSCHDALHNAALKLSEEHLPVLEYTVPMGPEYDLRVEDWLWGGYHDRQHADDIRRALSIDWQPEVLTFLPEIGETFRTMTRYREGFLRAVYSVADDAWGEETPSTPGWTYRDVLAHVTSNDVRAQTRFRALLGQPDDAEVAALEDEDGWNRREVEKRRDRSVRELIEELDDNRHDTIRLLATLRPEHIAVRMPLAHGEAARPAEYIRLFASHESRHAAQLVPATRARRSSAG
ncbi:MAG: maleylpyruvate isomerase N-terminal domain-containing protein [Dehalococcoidia bacterium]